MILFLYHAQNKSAKFSMLRCARMQSIVPFVIIKMNSKISKFVSKSIFTKVFFQNSFLPLEISQNSLLTNVNEQFFLNCLYNTL